MFGSVASTPYPTGVMYGSEYQPEQNLDRLPDVFVMLDPLDEADDRVGIEPKQFVRVRRKERSPLWIKVVIVLLNLRKYKWDKFVKIEKNWLDSNSRQL